MSELQVSYEPHPIPWRIHRDPHGKQTQPGSAHVTLTVYAVDTNSGESVAGDVNTFADPLIDDPNDLNFNTNIPQSITLYQATDSSESPNPDLPLYLSPTIQVTAEGYESTLLELV